MDDDDPVRMLEAELRARRRRLVVAALAFVAVAALVVVAAFTFRDRTVYLIGGPEPIRAEIEGLPRFRIEAPFALIASLGPGTHSVQALEGPARTTLEVPFAPWVSRVAAPVQQDQCLVVVSGSGFYEGATEDLGQLYVHAITHEPREVTLPPLFSDRVATHPCRLPGSIRVADTIVVIASVRCADAPRSDGEARELVFEQLRHCADE